MICEYNFDVFRHQRKNKQAKEKKEEKKKSCRVVRFPYIMLDAYGIHMEVYM